MLMLNCLNSVTSLTMSSMETVRPFSGLHSWRLTPLNLIGFPLKSTVLPSIFTSLKPTRHARMSLPPFASRRVITSV